MPSAASPVWARASASRVIVPIGSPSRNRGTPRSRLPVLIRKIDSYSESRSRSPMTITALENRPAGAGAAAKERPLGREGSSQRRDVSLADESRDFQPPTLVANRRARWRPCRDPAPRRRSCRTPAARRSASLPDGIQHPPPTAVCCSSASRVSLKRRAFLQRHAGLEREADQELELVRLERLPAVCATPPSPPAPPSFRRAAGRPSGAFVARADRCRGSALRAGRRRCR